MQPGLTSFQSSVVKGKGQDQRLAWVIIRITFAAGTKIDECHYEPEGPANEEDREPRATPHSIFDFTPHPKTRRASRVTRDKPATYPSITPRTTKCERCVVLWWADPHIVHEHRGLMPHVQIGATPTDTDGKVPLPETGGVVWALEARKINLIVVVHCDVTAKHKVQMQYNEIQRGICGI